MKYPLTRLLIDRTEQQIVATHRGVLGLDPPQALHHYTSPAGLLGILRTGNLWLTDALFLNDQSELSYGRKLVISALRSRAIGADEQLGTIFEYAAKELESTPAPSGLRVRFYLASFCENASLLSQWRAYAASGYSLGFEARRLGPQLSSGEDSERTRLRRVEYRPVVQQQLISGIIDNFEANVRAEVPAEKSKSNRVLGECVPALVMLLWSLIPQLKDPVFEEEREWRLVYTTIQDKPLRRLQFREAGSTVIPYLSVDLKIGSPPLLPIVQVTHAPSAEPELNKAAIRDLLKSLEYPDTIAIVGSEIPLRKL